MSTTFRQQIISVAVERVRQHSIDEPHRVFWIHAIPCQCKRHAVALAATDNGNPRPKYVVATVANGEVIPKLSQRH